MSKKSVDEKYARDLIAKFLPNEWSDVDPTDVSLKPLSGGLANSLWIVNNNKKNDCKFNRVILRHYGGNAFHLDQDYETNGSTMIKLPEVEETLIVQAMSSRGWGPKLLGVFPGGRIEEFIPSHTLTQTEASDPDIIHDLAVSFARFHSLQFPFSRNRMQRMEYVCLNPPAKRLELIAKFPQYIQHPKFKEYNIDWNVYLHIDRTQELQWIFNRLRHKKSRDVFCCSDTNFLNCLVRDEWNDYDTKTVLIDYELSMYAPRGLDIGEHFLSRMVNWDAEGDKASGHDFPPEDQRRLFAKYYLEEKKRLDPSSFNASQGDTIEDVLEEADVGALFISLSYAVEFTTRLETTLQSEPSFVLAIPFLLNFYQSHKQNCLRKYTHWI